MKMINVIMILMLMFLSFDAINIKQTKMYLQSESYIITHLIAKNCGVSNELMNYIENKEYIFEYPESNSLKIGEIVKYTITKEIKTYCVQTNEISITQYVILGSII